MNRITKSKEMPVYLFHQGTNAHAWELLGAHRQLNGKTNFWGILMAGTRLQTP